MSEETKPNIEAKDETISLKVKAADGTEVTFKVKGTTPFLKIMKAYAQKKAIDVDAGKFVFERIRLPADSTPNDYGLEDGDVSR